jgi:hypothetical protein
MLDQTEPQLARTRGLRGWARRVKVLQQVDRVYLPVSCLLLLSFCLCYVSLSSDQFRVANNVDSCILLLGNHSNRKHINFSFYFGRYIQMIAIYILSNSNVFAIFFPSDNTAAKGRVIEVRQTLLSRRNGLHWNSAVGDALRTMSASCRELAARWRACDSSVAPSSACW